MRLALTLDGRITVCRAPVDKIGLGNCNHIAHQGDETVEDFIERIGEIEEKVKEVVIQPYRMSEQEKETLMRIKGRNQLQDKECKGGYIELDTPLWNDMDKKYFAQISGLSLKQINSMLNGGTVKGYTGLSGLNKLAKEYDFEATKMVYVLPYSEREDGPAKHPLNSLYNYLLITRSNPEKQQKAYDQLLNNTATENPMKSKFGYMPSLADMFSGKSGIMRGHMSGRDVPYSGRAVVTPDVRLEYGEAALPAKMALNIFWPTLQDRLEQEGLTESEQKQWFYMVSQDSIKEVKELSMYLRESEHSVILVRQPSLHSASLLAFKPRISGDDTIKMNPIHCTGYGLDFDGDTMVAFGVNDYLISQKTKEIGPDSATHYPRAQDTSMILPTKESLLGLKFILSQRV